MRGTPRRSPPSTFAPSIAWRGAVELVARARHVVTETVRTREAHTVLAGSDLPMLGRLLVEGHEPLCRHYQSSVPEADFSPLSLDEPLHLEPQGEPIVLWGPALQARTQYDMERPAILHGPCPLSGQAGSSPADALSGDSGSSELPGLGPPAVPPLEELGPGA